PHADRDREALHHLVGARADDVHADDTLLRTNSDELHVTPRFGHGERVIHRNEARPEDGDCLVAIVVARGLLRQPDGADRGMAEYDGGDVVVVEMPVRIAAEQAITQATA